MKTKDLDIKDSFYCANTDAFLVLASRLSGDSHLKKHVIGWMSRRDPEKLIEPHAFLDPGTAREQFLSAQSDEERPNALLDAKDIQKHIVYLWEDTFVLSKDDAEFSGPDDAKAVMRRIARDYKIRCPKLNWIETGGLSEYDEEENEIDFSHRSLKFLLHEMAHVIHYNRSGDNKGPHHSPAFVWIAIELYNRYAGLELPYLINSARSYDILGYGGGPLPQHVPATPAPPVLPQPAP